MKRGGVDVTYEMAETLKEFFAYIKDNGHQLVVNTIVDAKTHGFDINYEMSTYNPDFRYAPNNGLFFIESSDADSFMEFMIPTKNVLLSYFKHNGRGKRIKYITEEDYMFNFEDGIEFNLENATIQISSMR